MLTSDQKAHFHGLGFLVVPDALSADELAAYTRRFDAAADLVQEDSSGARIFPDGHRVIVPLLEADPYFYSVLDHPVLATVAEDILGKDCFYGGFSDGQIHNGSTNWHRDGGWPEPTIIAKLTFYLDDVSPGKGCLTVIPGSHLWPLHYTDMEKRVDETILGYPADKFPGQYELPMKKGDLIIFNTRLWHCSWGGGANRRQCAWMMQTNPSFGWEVERFVSGYKGYAEKWSLGTGRLVSDRAFEKASPRRLEKLKVLQELGL